MYELAELVETYGFPSIMCVGLGYFVYYVWWFIGEKIEPSLEAMHFALIRVIDQTRMLDQEQAMKTSVWSINEAKVYFCEEMEKLGFKTLLTGGNFCHVAFGEKSAVLHSTLKNHVLYRQSFNHPCLEGFTRFSVAPKLVMVEVIKLIHAALEDL